MVPLKGIGEACKRTMGYEELNRLRVKTLTKKATKGSSGGSKGAVQEAGQEEKKPSKMCHHCKKPGHMKSECWKLHSELAPKRRKGPEGKTLLTTAEDTEGTRLLLEEMDPTLALMAGDPDARLVA